jgi:hypothetical protein
VKRDIFRKNARGIIRDSLASVIFTLLVTALFIIGLRETEASSRAEGLRLLKESLTRGVVQCYATEGSYPDSTEYIERRYGVYIDRTRYAVHYEIFASNILPDITVVELNGEGRR